MSVQHEAVFIDGERIGDAISVDRKVMFFTTCQDCESLDGRIFDNREDLKSEIRRTRLDTVKADKVKITAVTGRSVDSTSLGGDYDD